MLKIENSEVLGWEHAIRGMRNPKNSWENGDSESCSGSGNCQNCFYYDACPSCYVPFVVGPNDLGLMMQLRNAGTDHRKFMRMIVVYLDITAPLYWWKEFDTYKVGTVRMSCSTMHKLHCRDLTVDDFSHEQLLDESLVVLEEYVIKYINNYRRAFVDTSKKEYWWQMIQLLPSSFNQLATIDINYQTLRNIYHARKNHKLAEWHAFVVWILSLPYANELIIGE